MGKGRITAILLALFIIVSPYPVIYMLEKMVDEALADPLTTTKADVTRLCGPLLVGVGYVSGGVVIGAENISNSTVRLQVLTIKPKLPLLPPREYVIASNLYMEPNDRVEHHVPWKELRSRLIGRGVLVVQVSGSTCKISL